MSERDTGVPLEHYLQHRGCHVRFMCNACKLTRDFPVADVIARLEKRGIGNGRTGIRAVARLVERACSRCGGMRFETTPAWPGPSS